MKVACSRCKVKKPKEEYHRSPRRKSGRSAMCKVCCKLRHDVYYKKHKGEYVVRSRKRQESNKIWFKSWKKQQRCLCCPEQEYVCLDFHHLDPAKKDMAISQAVREYGMERLKREIAKCIVVCRNCHTKIHEGLIKINRSVV